MPSGPRGIGMGLRSGNARLKKLASLLRESSLLWSFCVFGGVPTKTLAIPHLPLTRPTHDSVLLLSLHPQLDGKFVPPFDASGWKSGAVL
jgi:hypothetical protein